VVELAVVAARLIVIGSATHIVLATVAFPAIAAALGLGKGAIFALVGQRVRCAGRLGDWRGLHRLAFSGQSEQVPARQG